MTTRETAPRCQDLDLDALAYGELEPGDELQARSHIALCEPCQETFDDLLSERRRFSARARGASPSALPSFDQLLARAEREPVVLDTRWQAIVRSWSSPFRGAVLQGAVGMFAVGALLQVALLRPPRLTESAGPRSSAVVVDGAASTSLDPWGESIAAELAACDEVEVCVEHVLALREAEAQGATHAASPVDPCAGQSQSSSMSVEWSSSASFDSNVEGVCAPDAI